MKFPFAFYLLCGVLSGFAFKAHAQSTPADSARAELRGAWRMSADTNVVLIFEGDSMTHRMMRTSGTAKVRISITDRNCDTTRYVKEKALYIQEIYRYYMHRAPVDGKICNKIIYLKGGVLILKRNGLFETYTKLRDIPPPLK